MNYFEFYGLPITFKVDQEKLKRIFYENSKKYHPDFFTLESDEKQAEILELSSKNNEAYQLLTDFDRRMKYILDLKGVLDEEGQNQIPQDFLMDMMDINENLMELEFDFDKEKYQTIKKELAKLESTLYQGVASIIENYDDENADLGELSLLKDFYLKKRYLLRIHENLATFATR
ncbi:MAG: hypothetical protein DHS20C18_19260 [Saprospiraceae bacterium]|nr:MAG: hypothetical protein DHS20C18_19260 [Saprospiraceae bacterium]